MYPDDQSTEPGGPEGAVYSRVRGRVNQPDSNEGMLREWFQGYDFPGVGDDYEPERWLAWALERGPEAPDLTEKLTEWTARLLDQQPDVDRSQITWGEQYFYNLLMFSAQLPALRSRWGLASSLVLKEALIRMVARNRLDGNWRGNPHRYALAMALAAHFDTRNQVWEWRRLLDVEVGQLPTEAIRRIEESLTTNGKTADDRE